MISPESLQARFLYYNTACLIWKPSHVSMSIPYNYTIQCFIDSI